MAAERNPYYGTNGAAAYDVYSANTVRQPVREPERRELPQEAPQKRPRVRARTAIAPFTILGAGNHGMYDDSRHFRLRAAV